jgi:hypothetical protein
MKNWLLALSSPWARAIETTPRMCGNLPNSAFRSGRLDPTGTGTGRIAGLRHESIDHPVKDDAIIKTLPSQCLDPFDMIGGKRGEQLDRHPAAGGQIKVQDILFSGNRRGCRRLFCHFLRMRRKGNQKQGRKGQKIFTQHGILNSVLRNGKANSL